MSLLKEGLVPDYYSKMPAFQPKKEIGDYVESKGIPVPRRFTSLKEALASGTPFVVRSEHPQDYEGVSGLLESFHITDENITRRRASVGTNPKAIDWHYILVERAGLVGPLLEAEDKILAQVDAMPQEEFEENLKRLSTRRIEIYSGLTELEKDKFFIDTTYSYWERLLGYNRVVVADNAIVGRYHIFTTIRGNYGENKGFSYVIYDNGDFSYDYHSEGLSDDNSTIPSVIEFYESVRHLDRFNSTHCPIVEMQTVGSNHYFLQYHRTLDTNPATFQLEREPRDGEIKAILTRGVTTPDGEIRTVNIRWHDATQELLEQEEGGLDCHWNFIFQELMLRRRQVQILEAETPAHIAGAANVGHLNRSILFKPALSVVVHNDDFGSLVDRILRDRKDLSFFSQIHSAKLYVISDGRKAYFKFD